LLFFLPLHLGGPLLYLLLQQGPAGIREALPRIALRGGLSALLAFALAMWAWPHSKAVAVSILALAMLHPWLELIFRRSGNNK